MADSDLRRKFQRLYEVNRRRARIYGRLARLKPDGEAETLVPGRPEMAFVRLDNVQGSTWAFHHSAVNLELVGLPLMLYRENGDLHIEGENAMQMAAFLRGRAYTPLAAQELALAFAGLPQAGTLDANDKLILLRDADDALRFFTWSQVKSAFSVGDLNDVTLLNQPWDNVRDRGATLLRGNGFWYNAESLRYRLELVESGDTVTVVPAGEIEYMAGVSAIVACIGESVVGGWHFLGLSASANIYDISGNTLQLRCTAGGGLELQRTAGTASYRVKLLYFWE